MHAMIFKNIYKLLLCVLALLIVGACSAPSAGNAPANAVESYLHALAERDENRLIGLTCGDWEAQARQEYNAFTAVSLKLDGVTCSQVGQEAPFTLVGCTGKIVANYGAEDLEIDVAEQTYRVVEEGGEWRVCGYQKH